MSDTAWVKLATRFFSVMFGAHHTTSWTHGDWDHGKESGRFFLYFTLDGAAADKAKAALDRAGVLCNEHLDGPQHYEDGK